MKLTILGLAGLLIASATASAQEIGVETRKAVQYGTHDGAALNGDLYLPKDGRERPCDCCSTWRWVAGWFTAKSTNIWVPILPHAVTWYSASITA